MQFHYPGFTELENIFTANIAVKPLLLSFDSVVLELETSV